MRCRSPAAWGKKTDQNRPCPSRPRKGTAKATPTPMAAPSAVSPRTDGTRTSQLAWYGCSMVAFARKGQAQGPRPIRRSARHRARSRITLCNSRWSASGAQVTAVTVASRPLAGLLPRHLNGAICADRIVARRPTLVDMEVIVRRQDQPRCASITCMMPMIGRWPLTGRRWRRSRGGRCGPSRPGRGRPSNASAAPVAMVWRGSSRAGRAGSSGSIRAGRC